MCILAENLSTQSILFPYHISPASPPLHTTLPWASRWSSCVFRLAEPSTLLVDFSCEFTPHQASPDRLSYMGCTWTRGQGSSFWGAVMLQYNHQLPWTSRSARVNPKYRVIFSGSGSAGIGHCVLCQGETWGPFVRASSRHVLPAKCKSPGLIQTFAFSNSNLAEKQPRFFFQRLYKYLHK